MIVARGSQAQTLAAEAPAGSTVNVRLVLTPAWAGVVEALGGGPGLVRNGRPVFRSNESFASGQLFSRTARSAIGQTADGHLLLVTVDAGHRGYSTGMTSFELALAMMRLGAVNACALGTGAGATLAFDGKLLSRPSGPAETPIARPNDANSESPVVRNRLVTVDMCPGALKPPPGSGSTRRSLGKKERTNSRRDGGGTVEQTLEFVKATSCPGHRPLAQ